MKQLFKIKYSPYLANKYYYPGQPADDSKFYLSDNVSEIIIEGIGETLAECGKNVVDKFHQGNNGEILSLERII